MSENSIPSRGWCGTMKVHRRLLDTQPGYEQARRRVEDHAHRIARTPFAGREGCTKIPVVVHVLWNSSTENVSEAQITSQLEVLNADFRKQNVDVASVPAPFAPLVADARVQFELAGVDPFGNATSGITRTETDVTEFNPDTDDAKFSASGGADAWPSNEYLNMWVCKLRGGILGYAQFPGGPAVSDGVVMTHTAFGTTGTAQAPFNLGRTATHEVGHWLNLFHIWGDDGGGCSGSDNVTDTPNQGGPNYSKPTFPSVSCANGPNGDMFMNFMDYVDDDAMVMFTQGQVTRMQAALDGPRNLLGETVSCSGSEPAKPPVGEDPKSLLDPPKPVLDPPKGVVEPPKGVWEPPKGVIDPPKSIFEPPKSVFEPPKSIFEPPKSVFEPPKSILEPPKGVFEPPKGVFEPPKSVWEPPKGVLDPPKGIFENPQPPPGPFGQPGTATPFVLGTGGQANPNQPAQNNQAVWLHHYQQLLGQYMNLHQRGILDEQGRVAWSQAWETYRQLGGS